MSSESFSPTKGSFSPSKNSRSRLASESSPRKERKYNSVSAIGNGQQGSTLPTSQMNRINASVSGRASKMSTMSQGMKRNKSSANSLVPCTGPGQMDDYIKYVKEGDYFVTFHSSIFNELFRWFHHFRIPNLKIFIMNILPDSLQILVTSFELTKWWKNCFVPIRFF